MFLSNINLHLEEDMVEVTPLSDAERLELDKIDDDKEKIRLINSSYTLSGLIGKVWYVDHIHGFTTLMDVFNKFLIDEYQPA